MTQQAILGDEDNLLYAEELGTLVFQSALMNYLAGEEEANAKAFENFVEQHVSTESFLEDLCAEYPSFEKLLRAEMIILQQELNEVVP